MNATAISQSLNLLREYIENENYRGFDPYDALNSPVFQLPLFQSNKLLRFGIQQLVKRSPFNIRPLLNIKKGLNPVTLGLCIQGYTALGVCGYEKETVVHEKCNILLSELEKLVSKEFHGACWGYNFPWEARNATIPAYQPTIVATGIITNALFLYYKFSGNKKSFDLCRSACDFVLNDLNVQDQPDGSLCLSYSPSDNTQVYNANMKGVRLLAQVYSVTKEQMLLDTAEKVTHFVMKNQQNNGSWYYSASPKGKWIDNYHTGYILDCLDEYRNCSGDGRWNEQIQKGFDFYFTNLFEADGTPKFFHNKRYPLDCTSASQAILTLCRFRQRASAMRTANITIKHMQSESGYFYFRKYRYFTERHSFMRWSNAWMFAALSTLIGEMDKQIPTEKPIS